MATTVILTQSGEGYLVDCIDNTIAAATWYIGWGTGTTAAAKGDTTIETEAAETRAGPITPTQGGTHNDTLSWVGTITCSGSSKTIANAGLMSAVTSGTMIMHASFSGVPVEVGDQIQFTFSLEIT
jgi:hypothetical protein